MNYFTLRIKKKIIKLIIFKFFANYNQQNNKWLMYGKVPMNIYLQYFAKTEHSFLKLKTDFNIYFVIVIILFHFFLWEVTN